MITHEITKASPSNLKLICWPCDKPKAVVHILHGMGEHKYRYQHFAEFLNRQGIQVYAHDHLGHGESINDASPMGHYGDDEGFEQVIANVKHTQDFIQERHFGLPNYILGHSMGSFIAQNYVLKNPEIKLSGLILTGSALTPPLLVKGLNLISKLEQWRLGKRGTSKILHFLSFGSFNDAFKPVRTESDWLSRDEAQVDKYINDPLCGFVCTTAVWEQLSRGMLEISTAEALKQIPSELPVLLISGDKDPVGGAGKYVKALDKLWRQSGHTKVDTHLIADARHEVLNESDKETTYNLVLQWIGDQQ